MENKNIKEHYIKSVDDLTDEVMETILYIDDEKYCYEKVPVQNQIILRRKYRSYGKTESIPVHVFDAKNVTSIEQKYNRDIRYFVVLEGRPSTESIMTIYADWIGFNEGVGTLVKKASFENVGTYDWIDDETLCIYLANGEKIIYDIWTGERSHNFSKGTRIWYSKDIIDYLDPKHHHTILIRENVAKGIAEDTITYGYNFWKAGLATRIDSKEQQRYIKKYNIKETTKHLKKTGQFIGNDVYKKCGAATMEAEIDKYLDLLNELGVSMPFSTPEQPIYIPDGEGHDVLNEEYLKKLRRRYYIGRNN